MYLNLCSDCIEKTYTSEMEYCGLTLSLAPECDECHAKRGKFVYYRKDEITSAGIHKNGTVEFKEL